MRFENKAVLVAGGTGALGRAVTLAFLQEGARVVVTYRNEAEFTALRKAAGEAASRLAGEPVDVTDELAVRGLVDSFPGKHGPLTALVNTVGAYAGGSPLWETEMAVLEGMLTLNLRSGVLLARAAVPQMRQAGQGSIVNVASKAAVEHAAGMAAYAASKAAAIAMLDSLAEDLKGSGVRVNSVLPSIIDSEANRKAMPHANFARWPKPEDIAKVIVFLSSEEARVIHGAAIPVYGNA